MKKLMCALAIGGTVLVAGAGSLSAQPGNELPPSPIRQAAQSDLTCANRVGRQTHGAHVSYVARLYPVDPIHECPIIIPPPGEE